MKIYRIFIFLLIVHLPYFAKGCNETKCGSIVSKCQLAESCNCKAGDAKCYKKCRQCLGQEHYDDCCDCVELCQKAKKEHFDLSERSHVEEFEGLPELFNALVADPSEDEDNNWMQFTYQIEISTQKHQHNLHISNQIPNVKKAYHINDVIPSDELIAINCTVIYMNECLSWNKCRHSCRAIGASSYRWFHDGCCECAGPTCLNYGLNKSKCKYCPLPDDPDDDLDENEQDSEEDSNDNNNSNNIDNPDYGNGYNVFSA